MLHVYAGPIIVLVCCACAGIEIAGQWLDWRAMRRHQQQPRRQYSFQHKDPK